MSDSHWELIPHTADIGVCATGRSKAEAFEQAAVALMAIVTDPATVTRVNESSLVVLRRTTNCSWSNGSTL